MAADTMTSERYDALMNDNAALTDAEIAEGWHFCYEWDGLLIHPSHPEAECCRCKGALPYAPE